MGPADVYLPGNEAELERWMAILPPDEGQLGELERQLTAHVQDTRAGAAGDRQVVRQRQLQATQRLLVQIQRGRALTWQILSPGQHTHLIPAAAEPHELQLQQAESGVGLTGVYAGVAYFSPHRPGGRPNGADHALAADLVRGAPHR